MSKKTNKKPETANTNKNVPPTTKETTKK